VCRCGEAVRAGQPEPAAPEACWEGDDGTLKVYADGSWWMDCDEPPSSIAPEVVDVLARALAEAKRDLKELGDVAGRALTKAAKEAARLSAEDMRERAEAALGRRLDVLRQRVGQEGRARGVEESISLVRALPTK
jgi:hypothetical protein